MMEPDYDPITNTGPNEYLKNLSLEELKKKNLLSPARKLTTDTIITVKELLQDYIYQNGQAIFYLEVKDPSAILKTAKLLTDMAKTTPRLLESVVIKFNMAEFPTYVDWIAGLRKVGANEYIMANPVMSPYAAKRINEQKEKIENPKGENLHDNASRAVYSWSRTPGNVVPNVEVVIKSSNSGFVKTPPKHLIKVLMTILITWTYQILSLVQQPIWPQL